MSIVLSEGVMSFNKTGKATKLGFIAPMPKEQEPPKDDNMQSKDKDKKDK